MLAAIRGPVNAALLLRTGHPSEDAGEDDVGVAGVDDDSPNAPGLRQSHVGPGLAGIERLVDAVAHDVAVANRPRLAGAGPHHAGLGRTHRQGADGRGRLLVEHRLPPIAAVHGLEDTARSRAGIIGARVTGNARYRGYAIADLGPDETEFEA